MGRERTGTKSGGDGELEWERVRKNPRSERVVLMGKQHSLYGFPSQTYAVSPSIFYYSPIRSKVTHAKTPQLGNELRGF